MLGGATPTAIGEMGCGFPPRLSPTQPDIGQTFVHLSCRYLPPSPYTLPPHPYLTWILHTLQDIYPVNFPSTAETLLLDRFPVELPHFLLPLPISLI